MSDSIRKGLRFDGPCLVLARGAWTDKNSIWVALVDRKHRATEQLGFRTINFESHAVFLCDDGRVRALKLKAFKAMCRHQDDRVPA